MIRLLLITLLFIIPAKQKSVCFAVNSPSAAADNGQGIISGFGAALPVLFVISMKNDPGGAVDAISGAESDNRLAMAAVPSAQDTPRAKSGSEKAETSPGMLAILIIIMVLMILVGVFRIRVMAMENDIL
jgi:hypothetical protein